LAVSRRRRAASPALLALLALLTAPPLAAQASLAIAGRVARLQGADTVPVPGASLTLHRVGRVEQGAIDSGAAGSEGRFRFRLAGDTAAIYLVSARYAGIEYFGEPVRVPGSDRVLVLVSDTSSTAPVLLGARHVIIRQPDPTGSRAVLDLFTVRNDGTDTRIGRDSLSPAWWIVLPAGATNAEVQEGDVSASSIRFRGDTLLLFAPVAPGRKNVMVSYVLSAALDRPRWTAPVDSFDLLVEEEGVTVRGAGLAPTAPVALMGSTLRRWSAVPPTGEWGEVQFAGGATESRRALLWLIGLVVVALAGGAVAALRSTEPPRSPGPTTLPPDLIGQLAHLDARYAGAREAVGEEEWAAYRVERARLKAAAEAAALARRRFRP
jgi:hypothetical protein